jgi:hypothetical protein
MDEDRLLADGRGQRETMFNEFIAFIGSGYNARGQFPRNLSELSDDCLEFAAIPTNDTGSEE